MDYVIQLIQEENTQVKICSTRRGGGLPFFVQAIVSSELAESGRNALEYSMKILIKLAEPIYDSDEKNFTKVLAMYMLSALFKDTRIGEEVLKYAEGAVMVAINGFDSKYWNVRNASTILYSSLLNRIFGVNRSRDEISKKNRFALTLAINSKRVFLLLVSSIVFLVNFFLQNFHNFMNTF